MPSTFVEETKSARRRHFALGLGIIGLLYVVAFIMPMLYMVAVSLGATRLASPQPNGFTGTLAAYQRFWSDSYYRNIMYFSVKLALASVVATMLLGLPLAYMAARGSRWLRLIVIIAVINPLFVSTIVRAFGLHMLLDYVHVGQSFNAVLIGTTQILLPFMVLPMMAGFSNLDPLTIHSARTLGSGRLRIAARIVLPQLAPGMLAGSVLVFILAMNIFSIPLILGNSAQPTMALLVYQAAFTTGNFTFAAAVALTLLAVAVVVIFVQGRVARRGSQRSGGVSRRRRRNYEWAWKLGRIAVLGLALFVLLFNVGVLFVVFLTSLSKTNFLAFPPRGLTLSWYGKLGHYKEAIIYSLKVALLAATLAAALGTLASYTLIRSSIRFKSGIMAFLLSPLIIPSTIFGLAALVGLTQIGWHPGLIPLVIALTIHASPFCVRVVSSGFQGTDWELEAAARSLGASRRRAFFRVIMPLIAPSVAMGFVITFILAFDDSSISIFLASPTHQTYGAELLGDISDHLTPVIAAAGSAVIAVTLLGVAVLALLYRLQRRVLGTAGVNPLETANTIGTEDLVAA